MVSVMPPSCGGFGAVPPLGAAGAVGYMMAVPPVPPHFQGYGGGYGGHHGYPAVQHNFSLQANTNFAGSSLLPLQPPPGLHPANLRWNNLMAPSSSSSSKPSSAVGGNSSCIPVSHHAHETANEAAEGALPVGSCSSLSSVRQLDEG